LSYTSILKRATYFWLGSCPNKPTHYAVTRKFTLLFLSLKRSSNHLCHIPVYGLLS